MSLFTRRRDTSERLDQAEAELEELRTKADADEPRVNALWQWAVSRKLANGIGEDFEWSLANPRVTGGKA